jgi:predicted DNA-binding protein YlxM (UPF0122 family)
MSEICKRYGLSTNQYKQMLKDGLISITASQYDEVIVHYRQSKSLQKTADHFNISKTRVYEIVHRFE